MFAITFAIGAGLAGLAGVVGGTALSISPGEDIRYLLASLVVVIVGGMGSVVGAAIGALLIGLAEQFGLAYAQYLQRRPGFLRWSWCVFVGIRVPGATGGGASVKASSGPRSSGGR